MNYCAAIVFSFVVPFHVWGLRVESDESKPVAEAFCYTAVPNESGSGRKLVAEPFCYKRRSG